MKWDRRYLDLSSTIASWSKDSTKVGAIAVGRDGQVLSQGYNGFPRYVRDTPERYADRATKLKFVIHAEMNCIYNASLVGVSLRDSTMYVTGLPVCHECAKGISQSGIKRVVISKETHDRANGTQWEDSWNTSKIIFAESGVKITVI
jgi:dCMP deaminase